jgi:hypothetical protein
MEQEERKTQEEERDEMEDLDVSQQQAEDVRGGLGRERGRERKRGEKRGL